MLHVALGIVQSMVSLRRWHHAMYCPQAHIVVRHWCGRLGNVRWVFSSHAGAFSLRAFTFFEIQDPRARTNPPLAHPRPGLSPNEDYEAVLAVLWVDDGSEVVPSEVEMPPGVPQQFASVVEAMVV